MYRLNIFVFYLGGDNYYSVAVVKSNSIYGSGVGAGQLGSGLLGSNACFPGKSTSKSVRNIL